MCVLAPLLAIHVHVASHVMMSFSGFALVCVQDIWDLVRLG